MSVEILLSLRAEHIRRAILNPSCGTQFPLANRRHSAVAEPHRITEDTRRVDDNIRLFGSLFAVRPAEEHLEHSAAAFFLPEQIAFPQFGPTDGEHFGT